MGKRVFTPEQKELKRLYDKHYRDTHKEYTIHRNKEYREANYEKERARNKKYHDDNIETELARHKQYYKKNKEKELARNKLYKQEHVEQYKHNSLKRQYGITLDQYNGMFNMQGGCCIICGTHQKDLPRALHVDHDHITGKVRGLLCHNCNFVIGHAKDSIEILQKAIEYLSKNK